MRNTPNKDEIDPMISYLLIASLYTKKFSKYTNTGPLYPIKTVNSKGTLVIA